jgi:hypothetical protein
MKPIDPNSRSQRILSFIARSADPVTHDAIVDAMRAYPADAKTKNLGCKVAATLAGMANAGKVKRTGVPLAYRYGVTPKTLAGRTAGTPSTPPPPVQASIVERERTANARRPGEFRIVDKPAPFVVPNAALKPPRGGQPTSEQIAADIAAFEAKGGRIQRCAPGERGQQFYGYHQAAANARKATKQKAADNDPSLDTDDDIDAVA